MPQHAAGIEHIGDAKTPGTTGPIDLTVKALDPGGKYSFDQKTYTAKAGTLNTATAMITLA